MLHNSLASEGQRRRAVECPALSYYVTNVQSCSAPHKGCVLPRQRMPRKRCCISSHSESIDIWQQQPRAALDVPHSQDRLCSVTLRTRPAAWERAPVAPQPGLAKARAAARCGCAATPARRPGRPGAAPRRPRPARGTRPPTPAHGLTAAADAEPYSGSEAGQSVLS